MKFKTLKSKFNVLMIGIVINFSLFSYCGITALERIDESYFEMINMTQLLLEDSSELTEYYGELRRITARIIYGEDVSPERLRQADVVYESSLEISQKYLDNLRYVESAGYDMTELISSVEEIIDLQIECDNKLQYLIDLIDIINLTNNTILDLNPNDENYEILLQSQENLNMSNAKLLETVTESATLYGNTLHRKIASVTLATFDSLTLEINAIQNQKYTIERFLVALFVFAVSFSIILLKQTSKSIIAPVEKLKEASLEVAKGNMSVDVLIQQEDEIGDLSSAVDTMVVNFKNILADINTMSNNLEQGIISKSEIDDKVYDGSYKEVVGAVNNTVQNLIQDNLYMLDIIKEFGKGNFNFSIKQMPGEKIALTQAVTDVQSILKDFVEAVNKLSADVGNGEFKNLLDASPYYGEWVGITNGLNRLVQIIDEAMIDTQKSFTAFSQGNFDYRITKDYKGTFAEVVNTTNYTAETVGAYISEISQILNEMANKNFNVDMSLNYVGDFVLIQKSVENIIINLNDLVQNIIMSAEQVSDGATQISDTSMALAEGATEQAHSVEKLTSITGLISEQSKISVDNSIQANNLVSKTKESASIGNQEMDKMLVAMEEINISSHSISNIIKVIDDIAFQTNILALNAAVEAARAGEHGKGFAVVAEEVRSLANRSQQAAQQTNTLIANSVSKVEEGSKIADNTSQALISIVSQIEEISTIIKTNELSSIEQQHSIHEITKNINEISKVTQINTSTSEESASASEELSTQASIFYNSVSDIKLKK